MLQRHGELHVATAITYAVNFTALFSMKHDTSILHSHVAATASAAAAAALPMGQLQLPLHACESSESLRMFNSLRFLQIRLAINSTQLPSIPTRQLQACCIAQTPLWVLMFALA